jgi:molybdopterin synthase catalytic subunit/molybdopterin synthase sulfur carrier subunit
MSTEVRLLAFAGARDVIGTGELAIALEAPETARAFLDRVCEQFPALARHQGSLRLAVNGTYARWDEDVRPGDEVALIPPVAGG